MRPSKAPDPARLTLGQRLRQRFAERFGPASLRASTTDMVQWFSTSLGEAILAQEQQLLQYELEDLFGYHLVQMGIAPALDLTRGSRIGHRIGVCAIKDLEPSQSALFSDYHQLPFASESVDLVLLHHLLEYSAAPHQLLREVSRVLIPHGHVVIVGFNPWSGLGLWRWVARLFSRRPLWRHRPLRLGRLLDWMQLVDLEPVTVQRGFYRPPVSSPGLLRSLQWLERWGKTLRCPGGGIYLVVARKEVGGAVPVKPSWEDRPAKVPGFGVNPLRRTDHNKQ